VPDALPCRLLHRARRVSLETIPSKPVADRLKHFPAVALGMFDNIESRAVGPSRFSAVLPGKINSRDGGKDPNLLRSYASRPQSCGHHDRVDAASKGGDSIGLHKGHWVNCIVR